MYGLCLLGNLNNLVKAEIRQVSMSKHRAGIPPLSCDAGIVPIKRELFRLDRPYLSPVWCEPLVAYF